MTHDGMPYHPAADLFPAMTGEEYERLADDLETHGLLEPITTLDGMILDGRHRERACRERGVTPIYREWDKACGITPLEWVIAKNLHRRQLTTAQKAALAVECEQELAKAGRERMAEAGRKSAPGKGVTNSGHLSRDEIIARQSAEIAGQTFGVHRNTVLALKAVKKTDEYAFRQAKEGKSTVEGARRLAGLRPSAGVRGAKKTSLKDALAPMRVYLKNWTPDRLGLLSPREAKRLLAQVQDVDAGLFEIERALEERSVPSRALQ